ncbi:MAG: haloacid dehalogenase-like hydrolase [Halanaerobiales bacterium]|nr:haloacid dehalogenase-like hydrolase [Halanaerobiales bacterium]
MNLAIFDFNGTIFPKETIPFLLKTWKKLNYSKYRLYKLYICLSPLIVKYKYPFLTSLSKEEMKMRFMYGFPEIFAKMSEDEIDSYFFKAEQKAEQYYNTLVIEEIEKLKKRDFKLILLSGAFIELLDYVGDRFGFDEVIGSTIITDRRDGLHDLSVLSGSKKINALKKKYSLHDIDWDSSYAFADSIDDLQLLLTVGNPVAVEPDQYLLQEAEKNNWRVINNKREI